MFATEGTEEDEEEGTRGLEGEREKDEEKGQRDRETGSSSEKETVGERCDANEE